MLDSLTEAPWRQAWSHTLITSLWVTKARNHLPRKKTHKFETWCKGPFPPSQAQVSAQLLWHGGIQLLQIAFPPCIQRHRKKLRDIKLSTKSSHWAIWDNMYKQGQHAHDFWRDKREAGRTKSVDKLSKEEESVPSWNTLDNAGQCRSSWHFQALWKHWTKAPMFSFPCWEVGLHDRI